MKNKVEWMDIVKINGEYYLERFDIEFEEKELDDIYLGDNMKNILSNISIVERSIEYEIDPLYDCSDFLSLVQKKYNLTDDEFDDMKTYLFDNIYLPEEVIQKFDIASLGGYINGVNI